MTGRMISEPLPHEGWSRQVLSIPDAIIVPPVENAQEFGVWGPGGDCAQAATWRNDKRLALPLSRAPDPASRLKGRHLWGGIFYGHFGHFIVESISRLWALEGADVQSVIFAPRHEALKDFRGYQAGILELLQLDVPVAILRQPTRVEELLVSGQGFGLGKISVGTPEFNAMIRAMADRIEPDGPTHVYVSRTRFNGNGGVLAEAAIERNMVANGYTPVYPEKMSVEQQLKLFKAARKVVGLDSSAFHMFGFVARPDQEAAIILRRSHDAYLHLVAQLESVMGKPPVIVAAVLADWMTERQKMANHVTWGEIDHAVLAQRLEQDGFIASAKDWTAPSADELHAAIEAASTKSQSCVVRRAART